MLEALGLKDGVDLMLQAGNLGIGLSFAGFAGIIVMFMRRRGVALGSGAWLGWAIAALLVGCGLTRLAYTMYLHDERVWGVLAGVTNVATAVLGVLTTMAAWRAFPALLKIPTASEYEDALDLVRDQRASLDREKQRLIRELNHRVRNNLQVILGSLRLQSNVTPEPCRDALVQALGRINAIARVHERIYMENTSAAHVETGTFLPVICRDLEEQFELRITARIENLVVTVDEGRALGMLVNELVTNAVKHGEEPVCITLAKLPRDGDYELTVTDAGNGIVDIDSIRRSRTLGMRLIRSMAQQLGGELQVDGSTFRVCGKHYAQWPAGEEEAA